MKTEQLGVHHALALDELNDAVMFANELGGFFGEHLVGLGAVHIEYSHSLGGKICREIAAEHRMAHIVNTVSFHFVNQP